MSTIIIVSDCYRHRASNIPYADLRHIIIVGNMTFLQREWGLLRNMPKISIMDGNPLNRADIRAVKVSCLICSFILFLVFQVNLCRTCVLLSAKAPEKSEPVLADKEIIMAALNIRSMDFGGSFAKVCKSISLLFPLIFPLDQMEDDGDEEDTGEININSVTVLLDLAFANNVRYLDDHEMYLTDQVSDPPLYISCRWISARHYPLPVVKPWPEEFPIPLCQLPTSMGRP